MIVSGLYGVGCIWETICLAECYLLGLNSLGFACGMRVAWWVSNMFWYVLDRESEAWVNNGCADD